MRSLNPRSAFIAVLIVSLAVFAQTSSPKIVRQEEFSIVGIEAHTSGERELSGDGEIPGLWQRFYREHILEKIPNKADQNTYAIYTDYSRDRMGEYTVVIGAKVKDKSQIPAGMVLKTVRAGQYAVLTSEKGPADTVIPNGVAESVGPRRQRSSVRKARLQDRLRTLRHACHRSTDLAGGFVCGVEVGSKRQVACPSDEQPPTRGGFGNTCWF